MCPIYHSGSVIENNDSILSIKILHSLCIFLDLIKDKNDKDWYIFDIFLLYLSVAHKKGSAKP